MPFTEYYMKDKLFIFEDMADMLLDWFNSISRNLRNRFKWTPEQIQGIKFKELVNIFEELKEDTEEENRRNS